MTNGNEPAFSVAASYSDESPEVLVPTDGLTKREYFAALAMQGELSQMTAGMWPDTHLGAAAMQWVNIADALIAALNEPVTK
jgi:hypothetical protein